MPFNDSSADEACRRCGEAICYATGTLEPKSIWIHRAYADHVAQPPDSASSSLDELCVCGHPRRRHLEPPGAQCVACTGDEERSWRHDFTPAEPEAPECSHESWEVTGERHTPEGWLKWRKCADCREPLPDIIEAQPHWDIEPAKPDAPPRRPPYAVAYQAGDGELYEVALAGDAVATVEHGALKVSHPSGVASIIQIRPMEGPQ